MLGAELQRYGYNLEPSILRQVTHEEVAGGPVYVTTVRIRVVSHAFESLLARLGTINAWCGNTTKCWAGACGPMCVTTVHSSHTTFESFDLLLGCVFNPLSGLDIPM
jgi:hypothetical protein